MILGLQPEAQLSNSLLEQSVSFAVHGEMLRGNVATGPVKGQTGIVLVHGWSGYRNGPHGLLTYLARGELLAVDAVNSPRDFMTGKRWIAERKHPDPAKLADADVHTRDELAELAVDELVEATGIDEERAKALILKAREHWFTAGESA